MAEQGVFNKPYLLVNSVDLSSRIRRISTPQGCVRNPDSASGDDTESGAKGLLTWSIDVEFNQDYAASGAGSVDATLSAAKGTVVPIEYRPSTDAAAPTNPKWTGNGLIEDYEPIAGNVGDQGIATCRIGSAGTLTRATS